MNFGFRILDRLDHDRKPLSAYEQYTGEGRSTPTQKNLRKSAKSVDSSYLLIAEFVFASRSLNRPVTKRAGRL